VVPTNRLREGPTSPLHLYTARPQKKPRRSGAKSLATFPKELAAKRPSPSTSPEESTTKEGSGIGGKPPMKRRAAKLVSMSNIRQEPTERLVDTKQDPTSLAEISARLALTRRALSLTRFQMARLLGTDMPTWGTYEAGLKRIPADQALKLSPYGIPLDWVYEGKMANLHPHISAKIRQLAS
jgi:DNA-binding transcriptional regulator YiaG